MKISVVIPLYNKEGTILRALNSVFNQTVLPEEIIVVNDGSTDSSAQIVAQLDHPLIRLVSQLNKGVSAARNRGITEAKNQWIAFLDADDEWYPTFLATVNENRQKHSDAKLISTGYEIIDESGRIRYPKYASISNNFEGYIDKYFEVVAEGSPLIWTSATVVRKDSLKNIGGFPEGVTLGEDLITWAKIAVTQKISFTNQIHAIYHLRSLKSLINPRRNPDIYDYVGNELSTISQCQKDQGIVKYLEKWKQMRLSTFVRCGQGHLGRKDYLNHIKFNSITISSALWLILSTLNPALSKLILKINAIVKQAINGIIHGNKGLT